VSISSARASTWRTEVDDRTASHVTPGRAARAFDYDDMVSARGFGSSIAVA
jgi:hypothetical protein